MNMETVEIPESTPFQTMVTYDARITGIEKELRLKEAQLKQTGSIFKKLQIMREIRDKRNLLKLYHQASNELMNEWETR